MPGRAVLVLASQIPTSVRLAMATWERSGHTVTTCSWRAQPALGEAIDAAPFDEVLIVDPEEASYFAIERSLRNHHAAITLWFETDASWTDASHLERAFSEDEEPPASLSAARLALLKRWEANERVRWVFRANAQRSECERLLGSKLTRAKVVAPPRFPHPVALSDGRAVTFCGPISLQRRHGVDLMLRTAAELDAEIAVLGADVVDRQLLEGRRLRPVDALGPGAIALITARDGSALSQTEAALALGAFPVVARHGNVAELWPQFVVDADPPALAERIRNPTSAKRASKKNTAAALAPWTPGKRSAQRKAGSPLLTVGVPAFNASAHLERCVRSIASDRLEVLIVNDGSTDDTQQVATRLQKQFPASVRVIEQPNLGHGGAINTALREARGAWFRVIDADDFVDRWAMTSLLDALEDETCDLVLTNYAEVRPEALVPEPVRILGRLPHGVATRFDTVLDPLLGLTSWGPLLSTSTFRTEQLRRAGFTVTEHSAYVDLEYCTFGLEFVQTLRHLDLDLYRYSLGASSQSVSVESYRKRYREHEAVILRLARFAKERGGLSDTKRRYIFERVVAPVAIAHLRVLSDVLEDAGEEKAFRARMEAWPEVPLPPTAKLRTFATRALKAALPKTLVEELASARAGGSGVAREVGRYVLPAAISRFFER
ncbi:MAG: glycosyltransferase family 2 protein [Archangium sp.]